MIEEKQSVETKVEKAVEALEKKRKSQREYYSRNKDKFKKKYEEQRDLILINKRKKSEEIAKHLERMKIIEKNFQECIEKGDMILPLKTDIDRLIVEHVKNDLKLKDLQKKFDDLSRSYLLLLNSIAESSKENSNKIKFV